MTATDGTPWRRLRPSALGLGTAALAVPYGAPGAERPAPEPRAAQRTIAAALDAGVRVLDTAPAYGDAETVVGAAAGARDCVIATKLAIPPAGWDALPDAALRAAVQASAEASLRALRRERLDVLQIHNATRALLGRGALLQALRELQARGLVAAIGATVYGEDAALAAIEAVDVVQVAFSALDRRPQERVLPAAATVDVGVVARSVLLRGVLSAAGRDLGRDPAFAPLHAAADAFRTAAGVSWDALPGAAAAYAATRDGIDTVLLGPRSAEELAELLAGIAAAGEIGDSAWQHELPAELLDPSRWPA